MADFSFSTGLKVYPMNGTELRTNLSDSNLYHRFLEVLNEFDGMEADYVEQTKAFDGKVDLKGLPTLEDGEIDLDRLTPEQQQAIVERTQSFVGINVDIDRRIKERLGYVFGESNDFDAIFQGVNVMAFDEDGNRLLTNFLAVVTPLIEEAQEITDNEVSDLVGNREQRRARNKRNRDSS